MSAEKKKEALQLLQDQGYEIRKANMPQVTCSLLNPVAHRFPKPLKRLPHTGQT